MDEACAYAHTPTEFRFCPFGFSFEVLIRLENLSKYVFVSFPCIIHTNRGGQVHNTATKLQKFLHFTLKISKNLQKKIKNLSFWGRKRQKKGGKVWMIEKKGLSLHRQEEILGYAAECGE